MGPEVPAVRTPVAAERLIEILAEGHRKATGHRPSLARLGVAWAHVNLETARTESAYNHNWGNIKATPSSWDGPYHRLDVPESLNTFRAYSGPVAGAQDYWRLLRARYAAALERFDEADPHGAAEELHEAGYFTAEPQAYGESLAELYAEHCRKWYEDHWRLRVVPLVASALLAVTVHYA